MLPSWPLYPFLLYSAIWIACIDNVIFLYLYCKDLWETYVYYVQKTWFRCSPCSSYFYFSVCVFICFTFFHSSSCLGRPMSPSTPDYVYGSLAFLYKTCSLKYPLVWFWILVFNATFSNISAISWWPVLVVEEAGVPREPPTMGKQLIILITSGCESGAPFCITYKAGREPTPYW